MNCDRSTHLDLAAFLAGEESSELRDFRNHYPDCPDCSREVRAWMEIHADLDPPAGSEQHPSAELLLQLESEPRRMSADARTSVESHLTICASCRDELRALRRFDFALVDPAATDQQRGNVASKSRRGWLEELLAIPRAVLLHPAFAYGLVFLLLLPHLPNLISESRPDAADLVAGQAERERAAAPPRAESPADRKWFADDARTERLAEESVGSETADELDLQAAGRPAAPLATKMQPSAGHIAPPRVASTRSRGEKAAGEAPQALEDRGGAAEELSGAGAVPSPRDLTIAMDASGRNNIPMSGMLDGATLRIKPQRPVPLGSDVAIRIKSADGRREMREIQTASRGDGYLELKVPPGWMTDGLYSLEVLPLGLHPEKSLLEHRHPQALSPD